VKTYREPVASIEPVNPRKVLEMGGGTLLVSLPKEWTRRNGVRKGATLDVSEISPGKLMVSPMRSGEEKPKEFVVEYPGEGMSQVTNDVTGAYLLGYDIISVAGARTMSRKDRDALKATIRRLVGLEIMDEDSKRMTVQFLLESSAVIPERIVKRMSGLLGGMLREVGEALGRKDSKLLGLVAERDDEVDRLYFLLVRVTRGAVTRPEVAERYGLSPVDLIDYRVLASFLESVGDGVTELSRKLSEAQGPREAFREYAACVADLGEMNDLATQAFISRRAGRPRSINAEVDDLASQISQRLAGLAARAATERTDISEVGGSLQRVSKLLVDVADLAVIAQPVS
jgi:phosphate uptake regulator